MNRFGWTLLLLLLPAAGRADTNAPAAPLSAPMVLDAVIARLPQEPLAIAGELIVRKQRGIVLNEYRFDMRLHWGANPATAEYTIRDAFGATLEQLTLTRAADGVLTTRYATGQPLAEQPSPPLDQRVQTTDFTWTDLTLAFLWWPGGTITGTDSLRNRDCLIVEVPAPPSHASRTDAAVPLATPYARVKLWIDRELYLLLQAEAFDADGARVRRLWVRSIQKENDRWMIKDLEIQGFPPTQRTRLHVRSADDATGGRAPAAEPAAETLPEQTPVTP